MTEPVDGFTLGAIQARLGGELVGAPDTRVMRIATLDGAGPGDISFLTNARYRGALRTTRACALIVGPDDSAASNLPRIVSANPYAYFARVSALLNPAPVAVAGVHASAVVDDTARIAASASVGACAVIGAGAVVGDRVSIGAGCHVGEHAGIGADTRLAANVTVYGRCVVGERCVVHAGVVIGGDGFGIAEESGRWIKVPQIGRAVIGDDVEIGANTCIDRGALDDTVIGDGVKLDNLIQIGHNVVIGAHTAIAACAGIAGSARIGAHCRIGGAAMIHGHIEICDGVVIAAGTMVRKSIAQAGVYDGFFPALPHREWMKNLAQFNRLDALADSVRALRVRLEAIAREKL